MEPFSKIRNISPSDWIIWVGAGISRPAPTCLPIGDELTEFSIQHAFNDNVLKKLKFVWTKSGEKLIECKSDQYFSLKPRLESILDVINEIEIHSTNINFSFMNGFKSFQHAPFNHLHLCLANFMSMGATIITCNFDLCIEKAFEYLHNSKDCLVQKQIGSNIVYQSAIDPKIGKIIHYHGIVNNISNMGATLGIIKNGFSSNFKKELEKLLKNTKLTFFFGYSFSDAFDTNPFFKNITKNKFTSNHAIFYQHGSSFDIKNKNRIFKYLECFENHDFINGNTSSFLTVLTILSASYSNTEKITAKFMGEFKGKFKWKEAFLNEVDFRNKQDVEPFLICRLANFMGIRVDKLSSSAFRNADEYKENFPKNLYLDTMAVACRGQGRTVLEKRFHNQKQNDENTGDLLGYYYSKGNYLIAQEFAIPQKELIQIANESDEELSWKLYTSMSAYCRPLITKYLVNPFRKYISPKDIKQTKELNDMINCLANRPLKNVKNINQIVTALRFKLLFAALISGSDDPQLQEKILFYYGERSGIEGFISTFRDLAIRDLLLVKYHKKDKVFKRAMSYASQSLALARIVGFVPGIKRARRLKIILVANYIIIKIFRKFSINTCS